MPYFHCGGESPRGQGYAIVTPMQPSISALDLDTVKSLVNDRLKAYCDEQYTEARHVGNGYATLWKSLSKLLLAGGKRLRPYMVMMSYRAYAPNASLEPITPAALAQELVHLALLIHDDIIDRDTTRYGIKNVTGQYLDFYSSFIEEATEKRHMAESSALLAGDVLLSDAYKLLAQSQFSSEALSKAFALMSRGVFEVVGGELLDTESAFIYDPLVTAHTIARYKTASYSFISPILTGATLAGANDVELKTLRTLAEKLGVGYQLRDDLLGIFGNEAVTGKSVTTDITEGKRTSLIEVFESLASEEQSIKFSKIFHNPEATSEDIDSARTLLINSGAKAAVESELDTMLATVSELIDTLTISPESRETFRQLAVICLDRES